MHAKSNFVVFSLFFIGQKLTEVNETILIVINLNGTDFFTIDKKTWRLILEKVHYP